MKHIDDQQIDYDLAWTYDAVGNRVTQVKDGVQTDYAYNAANELLSETTNNETTTYAYDGNGSLVTKTDSEGATTFTWTPEDLIKSLTLPNNVQDTFEYDGGGVRVEITDSTGATRYVWDGLDIVAELDDQNALKRAYAHGYTPIEGAYSLVTQHDAGTNADYFYHEDQVGGIHALTDAQGAVANVYWFTVNWTRGVVWLWGTIAVCFSVVELVWPRRVCGLVPRGFAPRGLPASLRA